MKIFFDTSVILAGLKSPTGGSGYLLQLSEKKKVKAILSELVLEEVKRNIKLKFAEDEFLRFVRWLREAKPLIVRFTNESEIKTYENITARKDAPVLAGANIAKVKFLVTLDKKHLLKLNQEDHNLPFQIVTPGELINLL